MFLTFRVNIQNRNYINSVRGATIGLNYFCQQMMMSIIKSKTVIESISFKFFSIVKLKKLRGKQSLSLVPRKYFLFLIPTKGKKY